jgi:hypothetical protein
MKSLFSRISRWRASGPALTSSKAPPGVVCVRRLIIVGEEVYPERETLYVSICIDAVHVAALMVCIRDDGTWASIGAFVVGFR